ncbi:caspase recruitment domain-containing protein 10-like [Erpetoichthys calabaricus]|uniref:caspase recruitment domain-containing protein 10-like n=1 Tax=Erpetoichthys calabaricus TaxID=27687 RepID=UPI0022348A22|nr:caspase recruitment domain-containing protein 10-like [Erpetoichthys calabaricus]
MLGSPIALVTLHASSQQPLSRRALFFSISTGKATRRIRRTQQDLAGRKGENRLVASEIMVTLREGTDSLSDLEQDDLLWEKVDSVRHKLTRILNPAKVTPYLRQCKVIDEQDEDEVLNSAQFPLRINRASHLIDILQQRGCRGYEAFMESLEFYHPDLYTHITGREPTQRCSIILDEEGPEGLTQFLLEEVKKLREQLKNSKLCEKRLSQRFRMVEEERRHAEQRLKQMQEEEAVFNRVRSDWEASSQELMRVKEQNYSLALKYSQALQEKADAIIRARDLQLQVDLLKNKLLLLEGEISPTPQKYHKSDSLSRSNSSTKLQEDNQKLRSQLSELQNTIERGTGSQVLLDILDQDRREALENRHDLCNTINCLQTELERVESQQKQLLQDREKLDLELHMLKTDLEIEKKRNGSYQMQLEEIGKERDQALRSRDAIQLQYTECMLDKSGLRKRIEELQDANDELLRRRLRAERERDHLLTKAKSKIPCLHCSQISLLSEEPCSELCCSVYERLSVPEDSGLGSSIEDKDRHTKGFLRVPKHKFSDSSCTNSEDSFPDNEGSEKDINRLSIFPFPPCSGSMLRRTREDYLLDSDARFDFDSWESEENLTVSGRKESLLSMSWSSLASQFFPSDLTVIPKSPSTPNLIEPNSFECSQKPPRKELSSPTPVQRIGGLADDITIIGGNRTGMFVRHVKSGSVAEQCGISEGCQLIQLKKVLMGGEDLQLNSCTREVAHFSLQWWTEPSALIFKPNLEDYKSLCEEMQNKELFFPDSFYVRVNLNLNKQSDKHTLAVKCDEILHILDTLYDGKYQWFCARVEVTTGKDQEMGTIPNYSRAQQLLLVKLRTLALGRKDFRHKFTKKPTEQVRLVKTPSSRNVSCVVPLLFTLNHKQEENLIPYSLVRPTPVKSKRPIIFSPSLLSSGLIERLLQPAQSGLEFNTCHPDVIGATIKDPKMLPLDGEQSSQRHGIKLDAIRDVMGQDKHCLLRLDIQSVTALIKHDIFPIIIHIRLKEKKIKRIRKLFQGSYVKCKDSEILSLYKTEEQRLEVLPLLHCNIEPDMWDTVEDLTAAVHKKILQEQKSMVWVECEKF